MPFETWLAYLAAYAVISITPGPSVFMVVGQSLSRGPGAAFSCIIGDLAGGVIVMTASYLGLGLLLASSSLAFMAMKWAGVLYMLWLGARQIRAARNLLEIKPFQAAPARGSLGAGFLTGVLNPKAIMFSMAFFGAVHHPLRPATSPVPDPHGDIDAGRRLGAGRLCAAGDARRHMPAKPDGTEKSGLRGRVMPAWRRCADGCDTLAAKEKRPRAGAVVKGLRGSMW